MLIRLLSDGKETCIGMRISLSVTPLQSQAESLSPMTNKSAPSFDLKTNQTNKIAPTQLPLLNGNGTPMHGYTTEDLIVCLLMELLKSNRVKHRVYGVVWKPQQKLCKTLSFFRKLGKIRKLEATQLNYLLEQKHGINTWNLLKTHCHTELFRRLFCKTLSCFEKLSD